MTNTNNKQGAGGVNTPGTPLLTLVPPIEGVKMAYVYGLRDNFVSHLRRLIDIMTYTQIAQMLDSHASIVSRWVNGQLSVPWNVVIEKYDKVLTWCSPSKRERKAKQGRVE